MPWDLTEFGGDMPYVRIFDPVPDGVPVGHAFPGGHSSGGFAFLSVYFLLRSRAREYRYYGLVVPVLLGIVFAATQEIRGAHFLSHDLFSLAICWTAALGWSLVFFGAEPPLDQEKATASPPVSSSGPGCSG